MIHNARQWPPHSGAIFRDGTISSVSPRWVASRQNSIVSVASVASFASYTSFHSSGQKELKLDGHGGGVVVQAARSVIRNPCNVVGAWVILSLVSCLLAPQLLDAARYSLQPAPGSPSGVSKAALDRHFPGLLEQAVESIIFTVRKNAQHGQADPAIQEASDAMDKVLMAIQMDHPGLISSVRSWRDTRTGGEPGMSYVSLDRKSWLMEVVWKVPSRGGDHRETEAAAAKLLNAVSSLNQTYAPSGLDIDVTGPHALRQVVQEQARHDVGLHAIMFLPIAVLAIHTHLWKFELLPLPALCSLVSLALSFAIGYLVACVKTIDATVPTLMAFLSISLSIDWSFFLLARFQEEVVQGVAHGDAILTALVRTGANIALSGLLIVACSLCMLTMPAAIASNAVGGCITVLSALFCCLTLLPACLALSPGCFGDRRNVARHRGESQALVSGGASGVENLTSAVSREGDTDDEEDGPSIGFVDAAITMGERARHCQHATWYVWASLVTAFPCNVVLLVLITFGCMPATMRLFNFVPAVDDALFYPPGDACVVARKRLHQDFISKLHSKSQMYILAESNSQCQSGVTSNGYFNATCGLAELVIAEVNKPNRPLKASDMLGVSFYGKHSANQSAGFKCIPYHIHFETMPDAINAMAKHEVSADFMLTGKIKGNTLVPSAEFEEYHVLYKELWNRVVSLDRRATLIVIQLPWDAMTWTGFEAVKDLRRTLALPEASKPIGDGSRGESCGKITSYEISLPSVWYDYIMASVGLLPRSLLLACLVTTPPVIFSFWTLLAPIKLLCTVILPITWVYGAAVWCFEDGLLDGALEPVASWVHSCGGLYWMVPCSTSMLLLALALDYNIFYFGRVFEFRRAGLSDLEAIRQGLAATGPVITCAGVIFAVEFSGLLFSETAVNRQGGFVVVLGILLDTFVVRSCLTPAILSLWAEHNWWPTRMPPAMDDADFASVLSSQPNSVVASRCASMDDDGAVCFDSGL